MVNRLVLFIGMIGISIITHAAILPLAWPTYQGNAAHTGYAPIDVTLLNNPPTAQWSRVLVRKPVDLAWDQPIVANGMIYTFSDKGLTALNDTTGSLIWSAKLSSEYDNFSSPPAYYKGKIYIQTSILPYYRLLYVYDALNGQLILKSPYESQSFEYYSPTPFQDSIYMGGGENSGVYSMSPNEVKQIWFNGLNEENCDEWTPAVDENHVYAYVYSPDPAVGLFYILNRKTGKTEDIIKDHTFSKVEFEDRYSAPVLDKLDQYVFVISGGRLEAFDINNHKIAYAIGKHFLGQVDYANGKIYANNNNVLDVFSASTGKKLWSWRKNGEQFNDHFYVTDPFIVTNNVLFLSTNKHVYAISLATHKDLWKINNSGVLSINEHQLIIFNPNTGILSVYPIN